MCPVVRLKYIVPPVVDELLRFSLLKGSSTVGGLLKTRTLFSYLLDRNLSSTAVEPSKEESHALDQSSMFEATWVCPFRE